MCKPLHHHLHTTSAYIHVYTIWTHCISSKFNKSKLGEFWKITQFRDDRMTGPGWILEYFHIFPISTSNEWLDHVVQATSGKPWLDAKSVNMYDPTWEYPKRYTRSTSPTKSKGSHDAWDRRWFQKIRCTSKPANQIFNTYQFVCMAFPPKHTKTVVKTISTSEGFFGALNCKSRDFCLFKHLSSAASWCFLSADEVLGPFEYLSQHLLANSGDLCSKPGPIWGKNNINCGSVSAPLRRVSLTCSCMLVYIIRCI